RYLPFWLATLVDRLIVLLIPLLGIGLPLIRFAPILYTWRVRRRIFRWYGELRKVEAAVTRESTAEDFDRAFAEIDRVETAVDGLSTPLGFSNQVYDLREHINLVRRRLAAIRVQKRQGESKSPVGPAPPELVAVRQRAT
ncbi:MAG TPA: hypothetical protein VK281_09690, partial [Xanthobacteraceae bacterium]|nr:hypothetical protein [Xanthobacteraceae bacterium]